MTAEQALEIITNSIQTEHMTVEQDKALAIVQKALEKQIPKKPKQLESAGYFECPCCKRIITMHERAHGNLKIPFCKWCGQSLD